MSRRARRDPSPLSSRARRGFAGGAGPFGLPLRELPFYVTDLVALEAKSMGELANSLADIAVRGASHPRNRGRKGTIRIQAYRDSECLKTPDHGVPPGNTFRDRVVPSREMTAQLRKCLEPAPPPGLDPTYVELSWNEDSDGSFQKVEIRRASRLNQVQRACVLDRIQSFDADSAWAAPRAGENCRYEVKITHFGEQLD